MSDKKLMHIVGTFLIQAEGAFLNGSTSERIEGFDATTPKLMQEFNNKIPYVSAQAWRHWLRETFQEEYPDEPTTPIETTGIDSGEAKERFTTKKVGVAIDPVQYPEHDIFGYMAAKEGQGKGDIKATIRSSPFSSSILISVRKSGWEGIDKGFVHPKSVGLSLYEKILEDLINDDKNNLSEENKSKIKEIKSLISEEISREDLITKLEDELRKITDEKGKDAIEPAIKKITMTSPTPLPYTTRFYNTHLQGIFGLAYHRIGLFRNAGDREELENHLVDKYIKANVIEEAPAKDKSAKLFRIKDSSIKLKRTEKILRSLVRLRGGAKQAQFGTDVSPKLIILAGLTSGNLIFNDLFEDTKELVTNPREQKRGDSVEVVNSKVVGGTRIKLDTLKQIIWDYRDRIVTPVYIGLRKGYLSKDNENELLEWVNSNDKWKEDAFGNEIKEADNKLCLKIFSPIEAVEQLLSKLKELESKKNDEL